MTHFIWKLGMTALLFSIPSISGADPVTREIGALGDVKQSVFHRYGARDDKGHSLDCLDIRQLGPKDYLATHHTLVDGRFLLNLVRSNNLRDWKHVTTLDEHASQGTLWVHPDGSFLLAYEKDEPSSCWIRLRHYPDRSALVTRRWGREVDLDRTLAPTAEGTPSFESVEIPNGDLDKSEIRLRFHYYRNRDVDCPASGTLSGFKDWRTRPEKALNSTLRDRWEVNGNIGDRTRFTLAGKTCYLQEGQLNKHDWSSWRVFLLDSESKPCSAFEVKTHGGSRAFANPAVAPVTGPDGRQLMIITLFLPSEGAAPGESGSLIYAMDLKNNARA